MNLHFAYSGFACNSRQHESSEVQSCRKLTCCELPAATVQAQTARRRTPTPTQDEMLFWSFPHSKQGTNSVEAADFRAYWSIYRVSLDTLTIQSIVVIYRVSLDTLTIQSIVVHIPSVLRYTHDPEHSGPYTECPEVHSRSRA